MVPRSRASASTSSDGARAVAGDEQRDAELDRAALGVGAVADDDDVALADLAAAATPTSIASTQTRPATSRVLAGDELALERPRRSRSTVRRRVAGSTPRATRGCSGGRARARSSRRRARRRRRRSARGRGPRAPSSGRPRGRARAWLAGGKLSRITSRTRSMTCGQELGLRGAGALEHPARLRVERRRGAPARTRCAGRAGP